ncbi:hypothetical protein BV210_06550 [Halorientalis sp. IM1011]|uniref:DUF2254 family protein n=1 Tax=Halorientalis sp. IM1011 TaxID=1932360 RepID=UPI00097CC263|nr:DUF2254 family protein [Halorientalis sp. IM1011]AQL42394.1 hypothetical protein BV210_06550 [Halorientalis sp. IM1011]
MVDSVGETYKELANSHWVWILISLFILGATTVFSISVGPELSNNIIIQLLTTLTTAVASVLAIVFSVLFISTQIASERYSPKFTSTFVNDPVVQLSFGLGIFCVISNIAILSAATQIYAALNISSGTLGHMIFWTIGGILAGLSIVFFSLLYPFIRLILIQTSPENMLSQYRRQYNVNQYLSESRQAEKISDHPMQPVYDFARNSIRREDFGAAVAATNALFGIPKDLISELDAGQDLDLEKTYQPVFYDFGQAIINRADSKGFDDAVVSVCDGITGIGTESLKSDNRELYQEAYLTAFSFFEEADGYSDKTQQSIIQCCSDLFSKSTQDKDLFVNIAPMFSNMVLDISGNNLSEKYKICLQGMVDTHNDLVLEEEKCEKEEDKERAIIGQKEKEPSWKSTDDGVFMLLDCTYLLMQITGEIMNSLEVEESPPGHIYECWESAIGSTDSNELEAHRYHLLRRYMELVVYTEINHDIGLSASSRISGIVEEHGLDGLAMEVCDLIVEDDRDISEFDDFRFLEDRIVDIWKPLPVGDYSDDFVEKVEEIKESL